MSYVDTSVIVAALDPTDPRSQRAKAVLEEKGRKVVSELVVAELASVLSRRSGLLSELAGRLGLSRELTEVAVILYLLRRFNLEYRALGTRTKVTVFGRMYAPMAVAMELSSRLRLKTLDLLHAAYLKLLKEAGEPIHTLVTADKDFKEAEEGLRDAVDVNVRLIE